MAYVPSLSAEHLFWAPALEKYKENTQYIEALCGRIAGADDIYIHKYHAQSISLQMEHCTETT